MNLLNEVDQLLTISGAAWAASIYLYASKETFSDEALLGTSTFNNLQSLSLQAKSRETNCWKSIPGNL